MAEKSRTLNQIQNLNVTEIPYITKNFYPILLATIL